jgi:hypothetical protein
MSETQLNSTAETAEEIAAEEIAATTAAATTAATTTAATTAATIAPTATTAAATTAAATTAAATTAAATTATTAATTTETAATTTEEDCEKENQFYNESIGFKHREHGSNEIVFLSNKYDYFYQKFEKMNAILSAMIATAGTLTFATSSAASATGLLAPIAAPIALAIIPATAVAISVITFVSSGIQFFPGRYIKSTELSYICMACFGFVNSIWEDVIKMSDFYSNRLKEYNERLKTDSSRPSNKYSHPPVIGIIQENLYKFLYFLLNNVAFEDITYQLGEEEEKDVTANNEQKKYIFLCGLLNQISFSTFYFDSQDQSNHFFKYSSIGCKRFSNIFVSQNKDIDVVLEKGTDVVLEKGTDVVLEKGTDVVLESKASYTPNCFSSEKCNNFNDMIMRLLENKIRKLIVNYQQSWINKSIHKTTEEKKKYFKKRITDKTKWPRYDDHNKSLFDYSRNDLFNEESVETSGNIPNSGKFRDHLRRLARELNMKEELQRLGNTNFTSNVKSFAKGIKNAVGFGSKNINIKGGIRFNHVQNAMFGTPWQSYREMLREYTIMTGNFSLLISKYLNHQIEFLNESIAAGVVITDTLSKELREALDLLDGMKSRLVITPESNLPSEHDKKTGESEIEGGSATKRRRYRKRKTRRSYTRKR